MVGSAVGTKWSITAGLKHKVAEYCDGQHKVICPALPGNSGPGSSLPSPQERNPRNGGWGS